MLLGNPEKLIDQLEKLRLRLKGKQLTMPGESCKAVDFHIAGLFLKEHAEEFIEALKNVK